ncbi:MAG: hypothetical protein QOH08_2334, partial [Chloroflexota bacterium]|nr:hypothetical protein [Chloroflexota bacterium]
MLIPRAIQPGFVLPRLGVRAVSVPRRALLVVALVLIAAAPHALNMSAYPAFTIADDEGIYASQALAWLQTGAMSPYVYSYDHAPGGWIQLALFYVLTGGANAFGTPIDTGRVLMLLFHVGSALLLYRAARLLGASSVAATLAVIVFSVSPLAVFYQRMVLLDNIMLFWLLASLVLALDARSRAWLALSGIAFGVAVLSKEVAVLVAPVLLVISWRRHGWTGALAWSGAAALAVLPYPAYALARGELWPAKDPYLPYVEPNTLTARPSLLSTLAWQLSRPGGGLFSLDNDFFWYLRTDWLWKDAALLALGGAAIVANAVRGLRDRRLLVVSALGAIPCLYLARGGITFGFYILFAVPFLALNFALLLEAAFRRLERPRRLGLGGAIVVLLLGAYWCSGALQPLYVQQPDGPGRAAAAW